MKNITVDIAEFEMSRTLSACLVAKCVGSGIVISFYDRQQKLGGLLHILFPNSRINPDQARAYPEAFADTGIAMALKAMVDAHADRAALEVKIAGGASLLSKPKQLQIGPRNVEAVQQQLRSEGIEFLAAATGGSVIRHVSFSLNTGALHVTDNKKERVL
jgi:chemotaxis protein CheD